MSKDFHILITARAREGTYQVRLYSVPIALPVKMYDTNSYGFTPVDHWSYANQIVPTVLDSKLLQSIAPFQVESESEFEQGVPRYASIELDFLADPALQIVVESMRDVTKNVWCEIVLVQNINDAPVRPTNASLVWPVKEKLCFWGFIDRKSCKGKVNSQQLTGGTQVIRKNATHDGTLALVFLPWMTWSNFSHVKAMLNASIGWTGGPGSGTTMRASDMMLAIMGNLCPTQFFLVADQQMLPAELYANCLGGCDALLQLAAPPPTWGKLGITVKPPDLTPATKLSQIYINNSGQLFEYENTAQTHSLTSDQVSTSLYHWNDLAQALTEWCREFFLNWQCELPTLEQASKIQNVNVDPGIIQSVLFQGSARFLLLDVEATPLTIALDPFVETIEYDPCGSWATTYTISEPSYDGLVNDVFGSTGPRVANSPLLGGQDESYTTLLRFEGFAYQGMILLPQTTGWDILVMNASNTLTEATIGEDNISTNGYGDWAALHAQKNIYRWGWPRAIVTLTSKGVGMETWGQSASIDINLKPQPIAPPQLTYGLLDYSDFPLSRGANILPGILAPPINGSDVSRFSTLSVKRTPDGDTELKLIEMASGSSGSGGVAPPPATVVVAPPPGGPPPPPTLGGPPDTGPITITGL